ncbi:hypothetical protein FB451DRAFT_1187688 [Mycena latifolia]|nr:hypothetical protein FB451DRAFT_1187688 [Mycena latifolia]
MRATAPRWSEAGTPVQREGDETKTHRSWRLLRPSGRKETRGRRVERTGPMWDEEAGGGRRRTRFTVAENKDTTHLLCSVGILSYCWGRNGTAPIVPNDFKVSERYRQDKLALPALRAASLDYITGQNSFTADPANGG